MNEILNWFKQYISLEWLWIGIALIALLGIASNTIDVYQSLFQPSPLAIPLNLLKSQVETKPDERITAPLLGTYVPDLKHAEVTDSHLAYIVVGIMYSAIPQQSQVLIQGEDGFSKLYRQGDFLSPSIQIKEIQADGVIILNQGRFERLSLPKNDLRFDPLPAPLQMKE